MKKPKWQDERERMSLPQLRLFIDEQVAALAARRARGDNPDFDPVRPRKLDRWEVRMLHLIEEEKAAEKALEGMLW